MTPKTKTTHADPEYLNLHALGKALGFNLYEMLDIWRSGALEPDLLADGKRPLWEKASVPKLSKVFSNGSVPPAAEPTPLRTSVAPSGNAFSIQVAIESATLAALNANPEFV